MTRKIKNDHLIDQLVHDPLYQVCEDGSILTFKSGNGTIKNELRHIKLTRSNGYRGMRYKGVFILLHRIMYRKFVGQLSPSLVINHKDGVRDNNAVSNLELVTDSENTLHAHRELVRKEVKLFGTANPRSKFNVEEIRKIRNSYDSKIRSVSSLAIEYGVTSFTIRKIVKGITYKTDI